ncbi:methyl-accepting chemotaxis protein [Clostridium sp. KNHs205]|uniref:methyl-accepting chemotaxis protein n=1 Tax=Clostridium sp. KNHs205 TaxID=1449050 RepID=UPI00068FC34A|nr:methyl-accepting chemotaxis protein [Clostridium sp. KNHs205]
MKKLVIKSIKTKLILNYTILIIVSCTTLGFMAVNVAKSLIIKEAEKSLEALAVEGAKVESGRFENLTTSLQAMSRVPAINGNSTEQQEYLKDEQENSDFIRLGIICPEGVLTYEDGTVVNLEPDSSFRKAITAGELEIDFKEDSVTGEQLLYVMVPIIKAGKPEGGILGVAEGGTLSTMVKDIAYGANGYAYIINEMGTIIGHPDESMVKDKFTPVLQSETDNSLKSLAAFFQSALSHKTGVDSYAYNGRIIHSGYAAIEGTDWIFVMASPQSDFLAELPLLYKLMFIIILIIVAVSMAISYIIGKTITKPIITAVEYSSKIAELDLTQNVPAGLLSKEDETGKLARAMQNIGERLRYVIKDIHLAAQDMSAASEELMATSEETAASSQQINRTIEGISDEAANQAGITKEGNQKAELLKSSISQVMTSINNVNQTSVRITKVVEEGVTEIQQLDGITVAAAKALMEIYEVIIKSNDSSVKIDKASNVIKEIAAQTSLLSLNASIEAARAGEAGKGFSVVAEEIKKLSEESADSTNQISEIVQELQNNTDNAVKTMAKVKEIFDEQKKSVESNRLKYSSIAEEMEHSKTAVKYLKTSEADMDIATKDIRSVIQQLESIAQENKTACEQAAAAMEEQSASVEEIAGAGSSLSDLAQKLNELVNQFKV